MAQTLSTKFIALALATTAVAVTGCANMSASPMSAPEFDAKQIEANTDKARKYLKAKQEYVTLVRDYAKTTGVNPINYPACDIAAKGSTGTSLTHALVGAAAGNVIAGGLDLPRGIATVAGAIVAGLAGQSKEKQEMITHDFNCDALQAVVADKGGTIYGQPSGIHPGGMYRGNAGPYQGERVYRYPRGIPVNPAMSGYPNSYQYGANDPVLSTQGFYMPQADTSAAPPVRQDTCWTNKKLCPK